MKLFHRKRTANDRFTGEPGMSITVRQGRDGVVIRDDHDPTQVGQPWYPACTETETETDTDTETET